MKEFDDLPGKISGQDYSRKVYAVFRRHLEQSGLRLTSQRRRILDFFLRAERHLGQEEIFKAMRPHGIGQATVFRTLKMLEECGLVNHVSDQTGRRRFEVNLERPHHDHVICISCGRIQEMRWPKLEKIQEETCRKLGFTPKWHRHEIFGWCKNCRKA
ncbi:MAG: Fur family transcriptional regulator [Elusimicrobiota bacterium]